MLGSDGLHLKLCQQLGFLETTVLDNLINHKPVEKHKRGKHKIGKVFNESRRVPVSSPNLGAVANVIVLERDEARRKERVEELVDKMKLNYRESYDINYKHSISCRHILQPMARNENEGGE